MTDPTGPTAVAGEAPDSPGRDRRKIAIAVLAGVNVLLLVLLLVVRAGDDELATEDTSTTTSSVTSTSSTTTTSTTTSSTTTTAPLPTVPPPPTGPGTSTPNTRPPTTQPSTTTAPPSTIAPSRCTGRTAPDDPGPVAEVFYEAWTVADRGCAERIATPEAVDELFRFDGSDAGWSFEGCVEDEEAEEPHSDCLFRYEGGTAVFELHGDLSGWTVRAVEFIVD